MGEGNEAMRGIELTVSFIRISPDDISGMVDITCNGDQHWVYADVGSHHGAQAEESHEANVMEFGKQLTDLMRKHFTPQPVIDKPLTKAGRQPAAKGAGKG